MFVHVIAKSGGNLLKSYREKEDGPQSLQQKDEMEDEDQSPSFSSSRAMFMYEQGELHSQEQGREKQQQQQLLEDAGQVTNAGAETGATWTGPLSIVEHETSSLYYPVLNGGVASACVPKREDPAHSTIELPSRHPFLPSPSASASATAIIDQPRPSSSFDKATGRRNRNKPRRATPLRPMQVLSTIYEVAFKRNKKSFSSPSFASPQAGSTMCSPPMGEGGDGKDVERRGDNVTQNDTGLGSEGHNGKGSMIALQGALFQEVLGINLPCSLASSPSSSSSSSSSPSFTPYLPLSVEASRGLASPSSNEMGENEEECMRSEKMSYVSSLTDVQDYRRREELTLHFLAAPSSESGSSMSVGGGEGWDGGMEGGGAERRETG